ncbi:Uncharacterised protein [Serratia fonticola]|uniref:Uncharacterized protein n=1 Tax=Serratia fonticola TaxID=47917 RepID=A0A4U9VXV9_SERFO|nr:Uncharacterised protein [Serratia fonticola]
MGVALAEIDSILAHSGLALPAVIEQQIAMLDRQLTQITTLRSRLQHMHAQLTQGSEPELNDWLITLEMMTMYDKYFTADELAQLPFYQADEARNREWQEMVSTVQELMNDGQVPRIRVLRLLRAAGCARWSVIPQAIRHF